jgi:hypothetical protein
MYLVVTNMEGYRKNFPGQTIEDYLTVCRGNDMLWERRIPAGATIEVRGGRVLAIIRGRSRTKVLRITIPRHLGTPIGKVSTLAGL